MREACIQKLKRVDRQMELYGLNSLQREVVHKLFIEYVIEICQQAEREIMMEVMTENLAKGQVH